MWAGDRRIYQPVCPEAITYYSEFALLCTVGLLLEKERASWYLGPAAADLKSCTRFPFLIQFLPSLQFSGGEEGESMSWKETPVEAALCGEQRRTIWSGT